MTEAEQEPILGATSDVEDLPPRWRPKPPPLGHAERLADTSGAFWRRKLCVGFAAFYVVVLLALSAAALGLVEPVECAVVDVGLDEVPVRMRVGSLGNIAFVGSVDGLFEDVDLSGVWSVRVDDTSDVVTWLLAAMRLEVLASFAGSFAKGSSLYVPAGLDREWGFSSTYASLAAMCRDAHRFGLEDTIELQFANSSFATFAGGGGDLAKLGDDTWVRTWSVLGREVQTVFSRAVYANGTTNTQVWQEFLADMNGLSVRVWGGDDFCRRKCETTARLLLLPGFAACRWCARMCPELK